MEINHTAASANEVRSQLYFRSEYLGDDRQFYGITDFRKVILICERCFNVLQFREKAWPFFLTPKYVPRRESSRVC